MVVITPLILERSQHLISTAGEDSETVDSTYQILQQILSKPSSPYILSPIVSNLLSYLLQTINLSVNKLTQVEINELTEKYQQNLKYLLKLYGLSNITEISQEFIVYYYDKLTKEFYNVKDITNIEDKLNIYNDVCEIISLRDIALWAITGKLQFIQADILGSLYSIDPDLLILHEDFKVRHLRDLLAHKWGDSMITNQWQYGIDKCTLILQSVDYDRSLQKSDISIDNMNNSENNSLKLSEIESKSYWEIKWWILFAMFLSCDYEDVVKSFQELTTTEKYNNKVKGNSIDSLKALDNTVINGKSIIRVVIISIILTQNNKERSKIWENPVLIDLFYEDQLIKNFKDNFESINFPDVNNNLIQLNNEILWCPQLDECLKKTQSLLFQKSILTYLSFVNRITLSQLSDFFSIDKKLISDFLIKSISILELPLVYDIETEIIELKSKSLNSYQQDFITKIHQNVEEELLRIQTLKLNNIINNDEENNNDNI